MPFLASIIGWFTAHATRLAIIGGLSMALGVYIYVRGQEASAIKCAGANADALVKEMNRHAKIHEKVARMSCADVDAALEQFMRPSN